MILGKLQEITTNISNLTKIVEYLIDQKKRSNSRTNPRTF